MKKLKTISLRVDEALYNQLEELARLDRRTFSQYVYYLLLDESNDRWATIHHQPNLEKPIFRLSDNN